MIRVHAPVSLALALDAYAETVLTNAPVILGAAFTLGIVADTAIDGIVAIKMERLRRVRRFNHMRAFGADVRGRIPHASLVLYDAAKTTFNASVD